MTRRRRGLSAEDARLWRHVVRHVDPLPGRAPPADPDLAASTASVPTIEPKPPPKPVTRGPAPPTAAPYRPKPPEPPPIPPLSALERKERVALRRGVRAPDAVIDLHGMRQEEAHRRLIGFLHRARSEGHALVLVVTGKGGAPGSSAGSSAGPSGGLFDQRGVLRRSVPHWLGLPDLRPMVVGFEEAAPQHGGSGALYVRLRRRTGGSR